MDVTDAPVAKLDPIPEAKFQNTVESLSWLKMAVIAED